MYRFALFGRGKELIKRGHVENSRYSADDTHTHKTKLSFGVHFKEKRRLKLNVRKTQKRDRYEKNAAVSHKCDYEPSCFQGA